MPRSFKNTKKYNNNKKKLISKILKQMKKYGGNGNQAQEAENDVKTNSSILGYNIFKSSGKDSYILVPVKLEQKFVDTYTIKNGILDTSQNLKESEQTLGEPTSVVNYKIGDKFDFQVSKYEDGIFEVKVTKISEDLNAEDIMQEITTELAFMKSAYDTEVQRLQQELVDKEQQHNETFNTLIVDHNYQLNKQTEENQKIIDELKQTHYDSLNTIKTAQGNKDTINRMLIEEKKKVASLQAEAASLQAEAAEKNIQIDNLNDQLQVKDKEIENLQTEAVDAKIKSDKQVKNSLELQTLIQKNNTEKETLIAEKDAFETELKNAQLEYRNKQKAMSELLDEEVAKAKKECNAQIETSKAELEMQLKEAQSQVINQLKNQHEKELDDKELIIQTAEEGIKSIHSKLEESLAKQEKDITTLQQENEQLKSQLKDQGIRLPPPRSSSGDVTELMQSFQNIFQKAGDHFGGAEGKTSEDQTLNYKDILYNAVTFALMKYKSLLNDGLFIKLRYVYTLPNYEDIFKKIIKLLKQDKIEQMKKHLNEDEYYYLQDKIKSFLTFRYEKYQDGELQDKYNELHYDAFEKLIHERKKDETSEGYAIILCEDANELLVRYMENIWDGETNVKPSVIEDLNFVYTYVDGLIQRCKTINTLLSYLQDAKGDIIREIDSHLDDKIITYVKFRHGRSEQGKINQRNIFFYMSDKKIDYNVRDDFSEQKLPLYLFTRNDTTKYYDEKGESKSIEQSPFTDLYSFGPFHRVFEGSTNQAVGENMTEVTSKLMKGENVFIMGYGASGAGKTSTLIEFQPPGQREPTPGALIYMLQYLANLQGSARRNIATLQITELFQGGTINKFDRPIDISYNEDKKDWLVSNDGSYTEPSTIKEEIKGYKANDFLPIENTVFTDTLLSTILSQAVNKSRLSRGTVNNPQSSRSHIIIDIHFDSGPHLFVGDFAGVEQKFNYEYIASNVTSDMQEPISMNALLTKLAEYYNLKIENDKNNFINSLISTFETINEDDNNNIYDLIEQLFDLTYIKKTSIIYLNPEIYSLIKSVYQKSDTESFAYPFSEIITKTIDEDILQERYFTVCNNYDLNTKKAYSYNYGIQRIEQYLQDKLDVKEKADQSPLQTLKKLQRALGTDGYSNSSLTMTYIVGISAVNASIHIYHVNSEMQLNGTVMEKEKQVDTTLRRGYQTGYKVFGENVGPYLTKLPHQGTFTVKYKYTMNIVNGELATREEQKQTTFRRTSPNYQTYAVKVYDIKGPEITIDRSNIWNKIKSKLTGVDVDGKIQNLVIQGAKEYLSNKVEEKNTKMEQVTSLQSASTLQTEKIDQSIANISKLLYYVQYLQNEIISRTYEGIFINTSLQDFRAGMAYNLKLKQMKTLPQSEEKEADQGTEAEDMVYRKTILSKLIPGSTDHYCGHTYGDIPLSIHFNESKISSKTDIIHESINSSIKHPLGGESPNELPEPIDINYCFMLVINNSKEANDPPRTAFIDTNLLKREYNRISTRNLPHNKNFLFQNWEMHESVKNEFKKHSFIDIMNFRQKRITKGILEDYREKIEKFGNGKGITQENFTSLLGYINEIETDISVNKEYGPSVRAIVDNKLNSLILQLDSLNAPSLIGTLVFADEMSKYNLTHYSCNHTLGTRLSQEPNDLYTEIIEDLRGSASKIKPLFILTNKLIKLPFKNQLGGYAKSKLLKNVSAKYKKTKRGKKLIKQSKKRKNKNT